MKGEILGMGDLMPLFRPKTIQARNHLFPYKDNPGGINVPTDSFKRTLDQHRAIVSLARYSVR